MEPLKGYAAMQRFVGLENEGLLFNVIFVVVVVESLMRISVVDAGQPKRKKMATSAHQGVN
jgi:NhaP-type Na+/H+ and K+/H+ antiporter